MVFVFIFISEKNHLQIGKKLDYVQLFIPLLAQKTRAKKNRRHF